MRGRGSNHQALGSFAVVGGGSLVLGLLVALGACEPDFDSLLAGNLPGGGGSGAASSSSTSAAMGGNGGASSVSSTTSTDGATSTSGSSSSSSTGASSSSGGGPPLFTFTFDTDIQSWTGRTYDNTLAMPTVAYSTLGHTAPGSVEGTMVFMAANEACFIRYVPTPKPDLTGKTITAWVYVESTTGSVLVSAFAEDVPNVTFVSGSTVSVLPSAAPGWISVTLAIPPASATWDPTNVNQFGVQVFSTSTAGTAGQAVVAVDDYIVQ